MTKITIIGNPGKHSVEKIKEWLVESFKKLGLSLEKIHLVFVGDSKQWEKLYQRYIKEVETLSTEERASRAILYFAQVTTTGYIHDYQRKEEAPPVILIRKDSNEISEESFLDETAHILHDKSGWNKLILEALGLIFQDYRVDWENLIQFGFFALLSHRIADYFITETLCQHGLFKETLKYQQKKINRWIKDEDNFLEKRVSKIEFFDHIMAAAFWSTLPSGYPKKEDEKELEKIFIERICQMKMESIYRKIKQAVARLESPPKVANIYAVASEIIELAQDFLQKQ